jgi:hypothetical protein
MAYLEDHACPEAHLVDDCIPLGIWPWEEDALFGEVLSQSYQLIHCLILSQVKVGQVAELV